MKKSEGSERAGASGRNATRGEGRGTARAGRRAGASTSRADILAAARARFAAHGYAATTIRQVARDAGVDPALVHYFFGSKDSLFAAVRELPYSPAEMIRPVLAEGLDDAGPRLVRRFLEVWEDPAAHSGLLALVRSAAAHPEAARNLREFTTRELIPTIASATGRPDGELRAVLVGSALAGLVLERYMLEVEPLASADRETVVGWVGPAIQRYLTGELGAAV